MNFLYMLVKYVFAAMLAVLCVLSFGKAMRLANPTAKTFFDWILPWPPSRMYPFSNLSRRERLKRVATIAALQSVSIILFILAIILAGSAAEGIPEDILVLLFCFVPFGLIIFVWITLQLYMTSTAPRWVRTIDARPLPLDIQIPLNKAWQKFLIDERFVLSTAFTALGATIAVLITAVIDFDAQTRELVQGGVIGGLIGLPAGFVTGLYLRKKDF